MAVIVLISFLSRRSGHEHRYRASTTCGCGRRGDLRHRNTLADLEADERVAEMVRAVVGDAGGLAGVPHRVADRLPACSGEYPAKRSAIVGWAGRLDLLHQP